MIYACLSHRLSKLHKGVKIPLKSWGLVPNWFLLSQANNRPIHKQILCAYACTHITCYLYIYASIV